MKRNITAVILLIFLGGLASVFAENAVGEKKPKIHRGPYHRRPPVQPLPATLDPAVFADDRGAFVAYALAGKIRAVLYQEPCYCYCNRRQGHQSLLDCYTNQHGRFCDLCRKEAVFSFLETERGQSPSQIRKALARGRAWRIDLTSIDDEWFPKLWEESTLRNIMASGPNEFDPKGPNVVPTKGENHQCHTPNQR
jgi:Protein of unknown function with PCYCGC motif